jgi:hypothetical protein
LFEGVGAARNNEEDLLAMVIFFWTMTYVTIEKEEMKKDDV